MVLNFPVMADYAALFLEGRMVFLTARPSLQRGEPAEARQGRRAPSPATRTCASPPIRGDYFFLNPGSISLPKGDGIHSYMVYEDGVFTTKDIDGNVLETLDIRRG